MGSHVRRCVRARVGRWHERDRKSTRLNSSHANISYAVFCLKKKTTKTLQAGPTSQTHRADSSAPTPRGSAVRLLLSLDTAQATARLSSPCGADLSRLCSFNESAASEIYTLSLHDALPILVSLILLTKIPKANGLTRSTVRSCQGRAVARTRSEEHTSELQSRQYLVCRLLLEKKNNQDATSGTNIPNPQSGLIGTNTERLGGTTSLIAGYCASDGSVVFAVRGRLVAAVFF